MKKVLICIFALLLLFLPFFSYTSEAPETSFGKLGNTIGNIRNCGTAVEDEKNIYYAAYDGGLYKEDKVDGTVEKIGGSIHGVGYLNISGDNIFYNDSYLGRIRRITKEGKKHKLLTLSRVESFVISGNRIYYKKADFKKTREEIYSISLDGRGKHLIAEAVLDFCVDQNTIYYINSDDGGSIWKMDVTGEKKEKLIEGDFSELSFDEEYIYYKNNSEEGFYRADKESLKTQCMTSERIRWTNISDEWIYFSSIDDNDSLYRMSKDMKVKEKLIDLPVGETNIAGEYVFYRLLENGWDRYKFSLNDRETEKLPS